MNLTNVLAVIFGVLFVLRKLETARRQPEHNPHIDPAAFAEWKRRQLGAYTLGSTACFLKVVLGYAVSIWFLSDNQLTMVERVVAISIDGAWVVALVVAWLRRTAALRMAKDLQVDLGPVPRSV